MVRKSTNNNSKTNQNSHEPTANKLEIIRMYLSDYSAQHHTRGIARLMYKSHVTLLPHLNELEKDKILSAKFIGKSKVYSLEFSNVITKNYLLMSELMAGIEFQKQTYLLKRINEEIAKLNLPGTLIIFGSYAKKSADKESDVDLFYIGEIKAVEIENIKHLGDIYGKKINLKNVPLNNFETALRHKDALTIEVLKNHGVLQNPDCFVNALWRFFNEIRH